MVVGQQPARPPRRTRCRSRPAGSRRPAPGRRTPRDRPAAAAAPPRWPRAAAACRAAQRPVAQRRRSARARPCAPGPAGGRQDEGDGKCGAAGEHARMRHPASARQRGGTAPAARHSPAVRLGGETLWRGLGDEGSVSGRRRRVGGRVPDGVAPRRPAGRRQPPGAHRGRDLPGLLAGYDFVLDDHSTLPTEQIARCPQLKHVIFLGTGARSYMDPEELAGLGITVHTIKGYGDTAVAEHAVAMMWAAARGLARMDRGDARRRSGCAPRACSSPARPSACWGSAASRPRWRASPAAAACA